MKDKELAACIIERLNELLKENEELGVVLHSIFESRHSVSEDFANHSTIQVCDDGFGPSVGMLGILNGICGVVPDGPKSGWGYIAAVYDDDGRISGFRLSTDDDIKDV